MIDRWQRVLTLAALAAAAALLGARPARAEVPPPPPPPSSPLPYKDTALTFDQRVTDLVKRMTIQQKAAQMQVTIAADPALGIPAMRWGAEALHGVAGATIYPDAMAMAATFDPELVKSIGSAIGDEARARTNTNAGNGGLVLWCPNVNLVRDPRWGRNMETFGEDPFLSGRLGAAYCAGMQGDDPKYLKVVATPKHYCVYSQETTRSSVNAKVSERALREYYLPPFEACFVEGHAASTMSAYNMINGIPCSAHEWLLTKVLRDEWHFAGAVCTDAHAVAMIASPQRYTDSEVSAVAAAVNSGVDVITETGGMTPVTPLVVAAEEQGMFKVGAVDRAVRNSLLVRFRLGLFDPPELNPYSRLRTTPESTQAHTDLALRAAREAITLLQNQPAPRGYGFGPLLPLDLRRITSLAVIGPQVSQNLTGSYAQTALAGGGTTRGGLNPLDALRTAVGDRVIIRTASAADDAAQVEAAGAADVVIFIGGNTTSVDKMGADRTTLDLPLAQLSLLDKVTKINPLTILILTGGSPINLDSGANINYPINLKAKCPAIVMNWYNGEQGGNALAEVLLGKYNPAGRLPVTFYRTLSDLPPMSDYEVTSGRTYLYYKNPTSFPFGHGLSYTTFQYDKLSITPPAGAAAGPGGAGGMKGALTARVEVANTGSRDGDEVVQVYARQVSPKLVRPLKQLVALSRVPLAPGQKKTLTFSIPLQSLAYWDETSHQWALDAGAYEVMVGASSEDIRLRGNVELK